MKKIVYLLFLTAVVLSSACKKNQCGPNEYDHGGMNGGCNNDRIAEQYAIGEDNGISFTDFNSVRDIYVHYAYDPDGFYDEHINDTILVEGYVGWWRDEYCYLLDTAISPGYYRIHVDQFPSQEILRKLKEKDEECDGKLWIRAQFVLTSRIRQCVEPYLMVTDTTFGGLL